MTSTWIVTFFVTICYWSSNKCQGSTLQCTCNTNECRRAGVVSCLATRACYTQYLSLHAGSSSSRDTTQRHAVTSHDVATLGCIDDVTPMLCEVGRPSWFSGAWPRLHCCHQPFCNRPSISDDETDDDDDFSAERARIHAQEQPNELLEEHVNNIGVEDDDYVDTYDYSLSYPAALNQPDVKISDIIMDDDDVIDEDNYGFRNEIDASLLDTRNLSHLTNMSPSVIGNAREDGSEGVGGGILFVVNPVLVAVPLVGAVVMVIICVIALRIMRREADSDAQLDGNHQTSPCILLAEEKGARRLRVGVGGRGGRGGKDGPGSDDGVEHSESGSCRSPQLVGKDEESCWSYMETCSGDENEISPVGGIREDEGRKWVQESEEEMDREDSEEGLSARESTDNRFIPVGGRKAGVCAKSELKRLIGPSEIILSSEAFDIV